MAWMSAIDDIKSWNCDMICGLLEEISFSSSGSACDWHQMEINISILLKSSALKRSGNKLVQSLEDYFYRLGSYRQVEQLWLVVLEWRSTAEVNVFEVPTFYHEMACIGHLKQQRWKMANNHGVGQNNSICFALCACAYAYILWNKERGLRHLHKVNKQKGKNELWECPVQMLHKHKLTLEWYSPNI